MLFTYACVLFSEVCMNESEVQRHSWHSRQTSVLAFSWSQPYLLESVYNLVFKALMHWRGNTELHGETLDLFDHILFSMKKHIEELLIKAVVICVRAEGWIQTKGRWDN